MIIESIKLKKQAALVSKNSIVKVREISGGGLPD
jgi:hypothetical protein